MKYFINILIVCSLLFFQNCGSKKNKKEFRNSSNHIKNGYIINPKIFWTSTGIVNFDPSKFMVDKGNTLGIHIKIVNQSPDTAIFLVSNDTCSVGIRKKSNLFIIYNNLINNNIDTLLVFNRNRKNKLIVLPNESDSITLLTQPLSCSNINDYIFKASVISNEGRLFYKKGTNFLDIFTQLSIKKPIIINDMAVHKSDNYSFDVYTKVR